MPPDHCTDHSGTCLSCSGCIDRLASGAITLQQRCSCCTRKASRSLIPFYHLLLQYVLRRLLGPDAALFAAPPAASFAPLLLLP